MDKAEINRLFVKSQLGDEQSFSEFYEKANKMVFSFVYLIVKNVQDAEDITQETFIKIKLNINSYKPGTNLTAWYLQIAKNLSIDFLRKQKHNSNISIDDVSACSSNQESNIIDNLYLHDMMNKLLNKEERLIISLHLLHGLKNREIANLLNIPLGTVLWKYNKAIKTLKTNLKKGENTNDQKD